MYRLRGDSIDMLTEVKIFVTDGIPTEEDVKKALSYAKENNCWVKIMYIVYGCSYEWQINPARSFEEVWANRIKVYGA